MAKKKTWIGTDGMVMVPFDDAWIRADDLERMLTAGDPNALSRIIMEWKRKHPAGTKEEFMKESCFSEKTVDNLW